MKSPHRAGDRNAPGRVRLTLAASPLCPVFESSLQGDNSYPLVGYPESMLKCWLSEPGETVTFMQQETYVRR